MSKSLGNVTAPQEVVSQSGADILRLWVVASDYSEDLRIGPEILKYQADVYRRLRNTLRYLLGALEGFSERERVADARCPSSSVRCCIALPRLDALVRETARTYDFHRCSRRCIISAPSISRPFISTSARTRSIATRLVGAASRRAHRARSGVRVPGALAGAVAVLHRGRGMARPASAMRRRQRPSPALSRYPNNWRDERWARNGRRSATCAASSPARSRLERAQKTYRLEPPGGGRDRRSPPNGRHRCRDRFDPSSALPQRRRSSSATPAADMFALGDVARCRRAGHGGAGR